MATWSISASTFDTAFPSRRNFRRDFFAGWNIFTLAGVLQAESAFERRHCLDGNTAAQCHDNLRRHGVPADPVPDAECRGCRGRLSGRVPAPVSAGNGWLGGGTGEGVAPSHHGKPLQRFAPVPPTAQHPSAGGSAGHDCAGGGRVRTLGNGGAAAAEAADSHPSSLCGRICDRGNCRHFKCTACYCPHPAPPGTAPFERTSGRNGP